MTLEELRNSNYFCSDYSDMELFCQDFTVGSQIIKYNLDNDTQEVSAIKAVIRRSDDPAWYDKSDLEEFEQLLNDKDYSFSGEFILDNDCYYVFAE